MADPAALVSKVSLGITALILAAIGGTLWALQPDYRGVRAGRADEGYIASTECARCHAPQVATWRATFHRTMTQDAAAPGARILGDWEKNNVLVHDGVRAEMRREGAKRFIRLVRLNDPEARPQELEVTGTVGSRRIQQYLTRDGSRTIRLPVAWDETQKRWMHLNGSFFHADGADYTRPVAEWNSNCVFCHNVKAQPGYDWEKREWQTEVAELGIACGACHGPAAQHAQSAANPLTRIRWQSTDRAGAPPVGVVHPGKINTDRAAMICGHCHGQRIPDPSDRIREIMSRGDPFDAGENLREFYRPVQRETKVGEFGFATRFWGDGSPRLTAYEYQGMTRSKCFTAGEPGSRITCISCHEMHGGDPRGQLTEAKKTNLACTACHPGFASPAALTAHTHHPSESAGSLCYNCHMPRVVFGVMSAHRTHDISNPRPADTAAHGKPNACNQCHADWSVRRAVAETARLWPTPTNLAAAVPTDSRWDEPEGGRALFGGDAVARGLAAAALHESAPVADQTSAWLAEAAGNDRYPIVRYFAATALAARPPNLPTPDYLDAAPARASALRAWLDRLPPAARAEAAAARERNASRRVEADVEVGE